MNITIHSDYQGPAGWEAYFPQDAPVDAALAARLSRAERRGAEDGARHAAAHWASVDTRNRADEYYRGDVALYGGSDTYDDRVQYEDAYDAGYWQANALPAGTGISR